MGNKELALQKIIGTAGLQISSINASCGKCNETYRGGDLKEKEQLIENNEFFKYRLTYSCPKGHLVIGADV